MVAVGVSFLWAAKNTLRVDHQGWFNNLAAVYQVISTIIIVITVLVATP
jgi:hypothetical protein